MTRRQLERFKGPNDLIVDSKGNIYFTDQGQSSITDPTGKVYRLCIDGRLDTLVQNGVSPNGLVLSLDERFLYVAMTRTSQVWRLPLHDDGTTTKGAYSSNPSAKSVQMAWLLTKKARCLSATQVSHPSLWSTLMGYPKRG